MSAFAARSDAEVRVLLRALEDLDAQAPLPDLGVTEAGPEALARLLRDARREAVKRGLAPVGRLLQSSRAVTRLKTVAEHVALVVDPPECGTCGAPAIKHKGWWQCDTARCDNYGGVVSELRPGETCED